VSNKITIIKVLPHDGASPSPEDLERWREIFRQNQMTLQQAAETGEVQIETLADKQEGECYITLVRVGSEDYQPSIKDLENWREVFEEAQNDPDFKIFTHPSVDISIINIGKIIAVE
jgi:hypothetical protein